MPILGIWDGHDAGAALVDESQGRIVCAANEERFTRRKLEVGFPFRAIESCLAEAGLPPNGIEDVAMDRAINGVEEPVYNYGKLVGTRIRYNDRLLMFMLRNRAPGRFAGGGQARGLSAMDKVQREKLKQQWREEWEEEEARKNAETQGEVADFVDQISDMHVTWWSHLSPRTRAAYREFRRLEKADFGWDRRDDTSEEDIAAAEAGWPHPRCTARGTQCLDCGTSARCAAVTSDLFSICYMLASLLLRGARGCALSA